MSIVVGIAPGHVSYPAVHLGVLLARSSALPLVVVAVNSAAWPPRRTLSGVDGEYQRFVVEQAEQALAEARGLIPSDIEVSTLVHDASSARRGLLEVCEELGALRLVVGAKDRGVPERGTGGRAEIALGSVVTGLLQGAHLPVAIAPHGFEAVPGAKIERVTAAYSGSDTSADLVLGAAAITAEAGEGLRIASFHTRPRAYLTARVGQEADDQIMAEWEAHIREDVGVILREIRDLATQPTSVEVAIGAGENWQEALRAIPWKGTEVLVVGSSSLGPLARISLGSHAVKIVRSSPVPVVLVPRRATEEYAAQAHRA